VARRSRRRERGGVKVADCPSPWLLCSRPSPLQGERTLESRQANARTVSDPGTRVTLPSAPLKADSRRWTCSPSRGPAERRLSPNHGHFQQPALRMCGR
jgi:hypothetical protein